MKGIRLLGLGLAPKASACFALLFRVGFFPLPPPGLPSLQGISLAFGLGLLGVAARSLSEFSPSSSSSSSFARWVGPFPSFLCGPPAPVSVSHSVVPFCVLFCVLFLYEIS